MKVLDILGGAMMNQTYKTDVISNNIANVDTPGFKKILTLARSANPQKPPEITTSIDTVPGPIKSTDNPWNFAIDGDGFFTVSTPAGERYTRNGLFKFNSEGYLVTNNNFRLVGKRGFIKTPNPANVMPQSVSITEQGEVIVDGVQLDTLKISNFNSGDKLQAEGSDLYNSTETPMQGVFKGKVVRYFQELSNVEILKEMTNMIETQRIFQTFSNVFRIQDDLYGKVANISSR